MKIIGGKDYYDIGLSHGIDDDLIFNRSKCREVPLKDGPFAYSFGDGVNYIDFLDITGKKRALRVRLTDTYYRRYSNTPSFEFYPVQVIFCGILYQGLRVVVDRIAIGKVHWSTTSFVGFIYWKFGKLVLTNQNRARLDAYFAPRDYKFYNDFLVQHKAAIAIADIMLDHDWVNRFWYLDCPYLRTIHFQAVIDPYQAFQTLSMYVGNQTQPDRPMIELSEKDKLMKHGMDKTSFRRSKQVRKK